MNAQTLIEFLRSLDQPLCTDSAYENGKAYLVQTPTLYITGRLVRQTHNELILSDAAWVADTGRFANAMTSGTFEEVEPYPLPVIIPKSSIIAATEWTGALPRSQK